MRLHVPKAITRSAGKQVLALKQNSPHILFVAGITGVVGGTIMACRATLKLEATLDDIKTDVEKVKATEGLSKSEHDRLILLKYGRGAAKIGRLYGPSAVVGGISLALITTSHVQMNRRNQALTGALVALTQSYNEYRERVRAEVGAEKEREIYLAAEQKEVTIDGKKQVVTVAGPGGASPYAQRFDDSSWRWEKDPEINRIVIIAQQTYLNHRLDAYGHVFLNEAYDALGLERTSAGAIVGWLKDGDGDGYIDVGIDNPMNRIFIDGVERGILLDFNVDGPIFDQIEKKR